MSSIRASTVDTAVARQRTVAVGALVLLALAAAVPASAPMPWRAAPAVAGSSLAALALAHPGPAGAIAVLAASLESVALSGLPWQLVMPLALCVTGLVTRTRLGVALRRAPLGRVPVWPTVACAAVTPVALVAWMMLFAPHLDDITGAIPHVGAAALLLGAAAFALGNALFEEWIWRGVLQAQLGALFPPVAAILLQAASFGAAHAHGFPRGVVGVGLAGAWGIMLGVLRLRAGGLLAPVVAHVVADATIAAIVLLWPPAA